MANLKDIEKNISEAIKADDMEKVKEITLALKKYIESTEYFEQEVSFFCNLDIPYDEKIIFLLNASNVSNDLAFSYEIIPYCIHNLISSNPKDFFEVITNNEKAQSFYADYFKGMPDNITKDNMQYLLNLPKFKEKVLTDEDFISREMGYKLEFFNSLPQDYGYLISLYNSGMDKDTTNLKELYDKYFHNILTNQEQMELLELQYDINNGANVLGIVQSERMKDVLYILKQVSKDKNFYAKVKSIQKKYNLTFRDTLCIAEYINDLDLENVDRNTINNLLKKTKEHFLDSYNFIGGPSAKTNKNIFADGNPREIRRIDPDGKYIKVKLGLDDMHEEGVKEIYDGSLDFPKECTSVMDRSKHAAKELSSITITSEREMSIVVTPQNISEEQKKVIIPLFENAADYGIIGIVVYDSDKDEFYVVDEGNKPNKDKAKEIFIDLVADQYGQDIEDVTNKGKKEKSINREHGEDDGR